MRSYPENYIDPRGGGFTIFYGICEVSALTLLRRKGPEIGLF